MADKPTPGPWEAADEETRSQISIHDTDIIIIRDGDTDSWIALVRGHYLNAQANAYLIASAPDLLAICQKANAWFGTEEALNWDMGYPPSWYDEFLAAIAKATGESAADKEPE